MIKKKGKNKKGTFKRTLKKLFFGLLLLSFIGVSVWVLFFSDYAQIEEVEILANKIDTQAIESIVNNHRDEFWFQYGSRNNFLLFSRKQVERGIKDQFETVRSVEFESEFPNKIKILIEERVGVVVWCSREKCFLLDELGLAFYELEGGERKERFKDYYQITDNSHLEIEKGQQVEEGQMVFFLLDLEQLLEQKIDLKLKKELETPSLISQELRVETENGWQIYFNLKDSLEAQVDLLEEVLKSSISESEQEKLDYIDLRVSGKAIYKSSFSELSEENLKEGKENEESESEKEEDEQ